MKQFQIMLARESTLIAWFRQIRSYLEAADLPEEAMLFRIFSDTAEESLVVPVLEKLKSFFPAAAYAGTTTAGNIVHGSLMDAHLALTCTIFEEPDSRTEILQLPMDRAHQEESTGMLLDRIAASPWVKSVEIMMTLSDLDLRRFCQELSTVDESIRIYGGGTNARDALNGDTRRTFVFSSEGGIERHQAVFILQGGPSFHIDTRYLIGWKKIGRPFRVTGARDNMLLTLNDRPAWEVYEHYLQIPAGEHFFRLANVFPLAFESGGTPYLRIIVSNQEDGSLRLGSFVDEDSVCSITYGDPDAIMESMKSNLMRINEFAPQVIELFSCVARQYFWGAGAVSQETMPFEEITSTSGYYTSGEFLRTRKEVLLHNSTIVIAAMREGEAVPEEKELDLPEVEVTHQLRVSKCLAAFINAQSESWVYN